MRRLRAAFLLSLALALRLPLPAQAAASLVKASGPAVYYVDDGKRYVFPNERVYLSWYPDFSGVATVTDAELAAYPIGGNVTYRPGSRLVKITSDPKVYAVSAGGSLRWIATEDAARTLFGADWNRQVDDLPDAFFFNYRIAETVASAADYDRDAERSVGSIADDLALRGGAVSGGEFTAVKSGVWNDRTVWGGQRPTVGSRVTVPAGVKVIYDAESSPSLKSLDVIGALEFSPLASTKLAARAITVRGSLSVGKADAPLPGNLTAQILLTGAASSGVSDDGLRVDGGQLDLHGSPVAAAWTRLAAPAEAGDAVITLDRETGWAPGSSIVIATTSADPSQNETRVITAVEGTKIALDKPLIYAHRAQAGLTAEVGLLSRNVVVSGMGGGLGSHVTILNRGTLRASDAEFRRLGRKGVYGQFPVFLDGANAASYVRSSVIHESGNRCLAIRQVRGATVEGSVASSIYGHCLTLEDGVESGNILKGNLVVGVRASALDPAPAGFMLRHPGSAVAGNVVAGSEAFGYWYLLAEKATRNDGLTVHPREAPLQTFSGNAVRAAKRVGLYVDDGDKGRANYIPSEKAVFSGLSAALSGERGFWIRGSGVEVSGATLAGNRIGGTFAAFGAALRDSTVAGRIDGLPAEDLPGAGGKRYGFTFLDGPVSVIGTTFSGFDGEGEAAFGFESGSAAVPDFRNAYRGVVLADARPWLAAPPATAGDQLAVARDQDAGVTVAADSAFLGAGCERDGEAGVRLCPARYGQILVGLRDSSGDRDVVFTNLANAAAVTLKPGAGYDGDYAYMTVAEGGAYKAALPPVTDLLVEYAAASDPVTLRFAAGPSVKVRSFGQDVPQGGAAGMWEYDAAAGEAVLHLDPGASWDVSW